MSKRIAYYSYRPPTGSLDSLDEVLRFLESHGAEPVALVFCKRLFGHKNINKLDHDERAALAIRIREMIVESALATGHDFSGGETIQ